MGYEKANRSLVIWKAIQLQRMKEEFDRKQLHMIMKEFIDRQIERIEKKLEVQSIKNC
jgi:hypothetical protein